MKKLMIAAVAALSATVLTSTVQAEVSSNVVGYNKATPQYSWHMMGMPFTAVDGGDVKIGSVSGTFEEGDQIQLSYMDDSGYVQFNIYEYWFEGDMGDEEGWYYEDIYMGEDLKIPAGAAVWFISTSGEPTPDGLTTSGAVKNDFVEHNGFPESCNMISSRFPVPFEPNAETITWSGIVEGDQIQVSFMDDQGYVQFTIYEWWDEGDMGDNAGWYFEDIYIEEPIAEVGQGFWLILSDWENAYMKEISPLVK